MIYKPEVIGIVMADLRGLYLIYSDLINSFYIQKWTTHKYNVILWGGLHAEFLFFIFVSDKCFTEITEFQMNQTMFKYPPPFWEKIYTLYFVLPVRTP